MSTLQKTLLERLTKLLPAQFESVMVDYGMPFSDVRENVTQKQKSIDLVHYAEQKTKGLEHLLAVINQVTSEAASDDFPLPLDERAKYLFIGREDELKQLDVALLQGDTVAITALEGMAGVGKSYLADHYALNHPQHFPRYEVLTLNPQQPAHATELLDILGKRLNSTGHPSSVREALQQQRVLLHVENVDSDAALQSCQQLLGYLPDCAALISGRLQHLARNTKWHSIALNTFDRLQGIEQIQAELADLKAEPLTETEAQTLVAELHGLPLALHLAAGYLADRPVAEFLDDLRSSHLALEPAFPDAFSRDQQRLTLQGTFNISLQLLSSAEQHALAAVGYLPTAGFGLSLAAQVADFAAADARRLLQKATRLGLVEDLRPQRDAPPRWRIHAMLAEFLRERAETAVRTRLDDWFLQRLPEPSDDDYSGWHELNDESAALVDWLQQADGDSAALSRIERAGSWYAMHNGPYLSWGYFCQRLLSCSDLEQAQRSGALWTLCQTAHRAGDIELAQQAAEEKAALDAERKDDKGRALAMG